MIAPTAEIPFTEHSPKVVTKWEATLLSLPHPQLVLRFEVLSRVTCSVLCTWWYLMHWLMIPT